MAHARCDDEVRSEGAPEESNDTEVIKPSAFPKIVELDKLFSNF